MDGSPTSVPNLSYMPPRKKPSTTDMTPKEYLVLHKVDCEEVWLVWSPGDSDFGHETILFTDSEQQPRTAVIVRDTIVCRDGWGQFYVECY